MGTNKDIRNLSPLRYPGSKKKIASYLYSILKHNNLTPSIFVEPFVGGGNVALNFVFNGIVDKAIIADKDKLIYSFWLFALKKPAYLIDFIKRIRVNLNSFYKYKSIAKNSSRCKNSELAEACIFLNRTSFSGILNDQAGPIGGVKQKSDYKINCRFNKKRLIKKIKLISALNKKIIVLPYDWRKTIAYVNKLRKKETLDSNQIFFYFDPPFYNKAAALYRCSFDNNAHKQFSKKLMKLKHNWVLSYDNADEIKKLYSKNKYMHIDMPYSINSHAKKIKKELIITSLKLPQIS
jgi:DNA adenine methylase